MTFFRGFEKAAFWGGNLLGFSDHSAPVPVPYSYHPSTSPESEDEADAMSKMTPRERKVYERMRREEAMKAYQQMGRIGY